MKNYWRTGKNWLVRLRFYGLRNTISLVKYLKINNQFSLLINNHKFLLRGNTVDFAVFDSIIRKGEYNLDIGITPDIIVDAGANIGASTLYFRRRYPNAKIIAIEPERSNFALLKQNLSDYKGVILANYAIWPENTKLMISNPDAEKYAFQMKETDEHLGAIDGVTIERLMEIWNLQQIDLLKIDIEGSEKMLFNKPDLDWLKKVRVMIIELHDAIIPGTSEAFNEAIKCIDSTIFRSGENIVVVNRGLANG